MANISRFGKCGGSARAVWVWKLRPFWTSLGDLGGLLGQQDGLDVGQHAALRDGDTAHEFVQLFVVAYGQLQVTGIDSCLLVVTGGIAGQFQDLCGQILHDGGQVDGGSGTHAFGVISLAQEAVDPAYGKLETGSCRPALGLAANFSALSTSRHLEVILSAGIEAKCDEPLRQDYLKLSGGSGEFSRAANWVTRARLAWMGACPKLRSQEGRRKYLDNAGVIHPS